ncbi:transposase [Arthrobacter sp. LAPM80]|uniref:transposase n=1 Tax=Arthrobacter sp. LAPM80 TaxID=3141788 RepID=UPI00398BAD0E
MNRRVLRLASTLFMGLRLHLVCTLRGLPVGYALTGAKADERLVFLDVLAGTPAMNRLQADGHRQVMIGDKNYFGADFEETVDQSGVELLRSARKGEKSRPEARFFKPLRQIIEFINDTLKGQLDLEQHGGRTPAGVIARVIQRMLGMTAYHH